MNTAFLITANAVSVFLGAKSYIVPSTHPNFTAIKTALQEGRGEEVEAMIDVPTRIEQWAGETGFVLDDGKLSLLDQPFPDVVSSKALRMIEAGQPATYLARFLRKLRDNPSASSQEHLLGFIEGCGFALHEDGDFIAFKGIREDYTDAHSGTINNRPGALIPRLERWQVDDDRHLACSFGYHVGSQTYAQSYGRRTVAVKVNPADVVSVPSDLSIGKARVTYYEVLAEIDRVAPFVKDETIVSDAQYESGEFSRQEWRLAVDAEETELGYDAWVEEKRAEAEELGDDDEDGEDDEETVEQKTERLTAAWRDGVINSNITYSLEEYLDAHWDDK